MPYNLRKRPSTAQKQAAPVRNNKVPKRQRRTPSVESVTNLLQLPTENLSHVFSFFKPQELLPARLVCTTLANVASRPEDIINESVRKGFIDGYDFSFYNEARFSKLKQAFAVKKHISNIQNAIHAFLVTFLEVGENLPEIELDTTYDDIGIGDNPTLHYYGFSQVDHSLGAIYQLGNHPCYQLKWVKIFDDVLSSFVNYRGDGHWSGEKANLLASLFKGRNKAGANLLHLVVQAFKDPDCKDIVELLITKYSADYGQNIRGIFTFLIGGVRQEHSSLLDVIPYENKLTKAYVTQLFAENPQNVEAQEATTPNLVL